MSKGPPKNAWYYSSWDSVAECHICPLVKLDTLLDSSFQSLSLGGSGLGSREVREASGFLFATASVGLGWFISLIGKTLRKSSPAGISRMMGQLQRDFSTWKRQQIITKYVQLCSWLYLWHDYCFKCHLDIGWFMNHKLSYSLDLSVSVLSCHASFFGFFELYSISNGEFREQQKASSPGGFYWEEGEWQHTLEIRQETATLHVIRVISEAAVTVWSSTSILHTLSWRLRDF